MFILKVGPREAGGHIGMHVRCYAGLYPIFDSFLIRTSLLHDTFIAILTYPWALSYEFCFNLLHFRKKHVTELKI